MTRRWDPTTRLRLFRGALLFTLVSVLGWCWEITVEWAVLRIWVNRGFLTGPYLPIYGFGALSIAAIWSRVGAPAGGTAPQSALCLFLLSAGLTTAVEFCTSWVMERLFQYRWWDYSRYFCNLDGRVCLYSALLLGCGGLLAVRALLPRLSRLLDRLPPLLENYLALPCILLVSVDFLHTLLVAL